MHILKERRSPRNISKNMPSINLYYLRIITELKANTALSKAIQVIYKISQEGRMFAQGNYPTAEFSDATQILPP